MKEHERKLDRFYMNTSIYPPSEIVQNLDTLLEVYFLLREHSLRQSIAHSDKKSRTLSGSIPILQVEEYRRRDSAGVGGTNLPKILAISSQILKIVRHREKVESRSKNCALE